MTDSTIDLSEQHGTSGKQLSMRKQYETVHCLMLPLHKEIAILPNAAVAEIVPYQQLDDFEHAPEWILGLLNWRERRIPVVSFEIASEGTPGKIHKSCRIAIVNTLNGNPQLPYFGLLTQSLPSLQIVRPNMIGEDNIGTLDRPSVKALANINGAIALIPDIDDLESRLHALL